MGRNSLLLLSAGLLGVLACGDGGGDKASPDASIDEPAKSSEWTVFVYGHGDHNLSNSLVRDIAEMAQAKLNANVQVVVLADFDASQTVAGTEDTFPTGAYWMRIPGGNQEPEELATEDELNFDDPQVLRGAVAYAFTKFPSKRRALILWNHGGSWNGGFGGDMQDGTAQSLTPMAASVAAKAIREGLADAEIEGPLDVFSFDTCLMAGSEVIAEFTDLAEVYIANAEIDYGDGWDYAGFLSHLAENPGDGAVKVAAKEVALWNAHHAQVSSNDILLRSHVAIDLKKYKAFEKAYASFVEALLQSEDVSGIELGRAAYFSLPPYMNQLSNPGDVPELRDAGLFLSRLANTAGDDALAHSAMAALGALEAAILGRSQGTLRESAGQHGVHIELPLAAHISADKLSVYEALAPSFVRQSRWNEALAAYGALDDQVAPTIQASIRNDVDPDATRLPTVTFSVPDTDLAEVQVDIAQVVDPLASNELLFFGVAAKGAIEPNTEYDVSWDGQLTALPDGAGGLQPVFVRVWEDLGNDVATGQAAAPLLATFGVVNTTDGQEVFGALLFQDGDETTGLLAIFEPAITLSLGDVAQDLPGTTFTPLLPSISLSPPAEGVYPGTPIALDTPSLPVSRGAAGPGVYALLTSATDVFGNSGVDLQYAQLSESIVFP